MTTTITDGTTTWTAYSIDGYSADSNSRNVVHAILGTNQKAVALRDAELRSGSIKLLFQTYATASAVWAALRLGQSLMLADTDVTGIGMKFVLSGTASMELDNDTRLYWWVEFDYTEVT